MTAALSPRELVKGLDLEEIDASIETIKQELVALEALRRVAVARDEGTLGNDPARGPAGSRSGSKPRARPGERVIDRLEAALRTKGPLTYDEASSLIDTPKSNLYVAVQKHPRMSIVGGLIHLAQAEDAGSRSLTEPSSTA